MRQKGSLSKSKAESMYKYFKAGKQAKFVSHCVYMCVCACVYVSHPQIHSVKCNIESVALALAVCLLRVAQVLCWLILFVVMNLSEI